MGDEKAIEKYFQACEKQSEYVQMMMISMKIILENLLVMVVVVVIVPIAVIKYGFVKNLNKKIKRDVTAIVSLIKYTIALIQVLRQNLPVHKRFECVVKRHPNKVAILFEDEIWNFAKVDELSNKVAIYFEQEGYNQGDCVALLLDNCPDYTSLWMGLSKIGVVTSLLNINLGIDSLKHSIEIVNCKAIIFGSSFEEKVNSIMSEIPLKGYIFKRFNETASTISSNHINLSEELSVIDPKKPLKNNYKILTSDPLLYIYTSGTTGLPKAAIMNHFRYSLFFCSAKLISKNVDNLIVYCPMPLYHGSGVVMGIGQMVLSGATVALRKKFSASNYWKDCKRYNCNAAQYIGEMLRYVLMAPENQEVNHSLEVIYGNGLKPLIWKQYVEKFKVKRVFELYASTEGTIGLYNVDNTIGNVGYFPSYIRKILPFKLIRVCEDTGEPIKNDNGFCIQCQENESGLAIGKLNHKERSMLNFQGYTDKKETSKKILRDVFKKGDTYFNSGDVLSFDQEGYYYFVDRLGDTFRWKGENVSTTEIESIISKIIGLNDAAVYGVQVPGTEGRAGMVSLIDTGGNLDMDFLLRQFQQNIASYAIPIFTLPVATEKLIKFDAVSIQSHYEASLVSTLLNTDPHLLVLAVDSGALIGFSKMKYKLWWWEKQNYTVPKLFGQLLKSHPQKLAIYSEEKSWTYEQVNEYSNQIANYFKSCGFKKGDCIALLLENRVEYVCIWLGLSKLGVITALINTNLVNDPLLHSFKVAKSKAVIFGNNHADAMKNVAHKLNMELYQLNEDDNTSTVNKCVRLKKELEKTSSEEPEEIELSCRSPLVYIYTSGTTGLPKAAIISHIRFTFMATAFNSMAGLKEHDIIYNPLPLYHTAGGMVGMGQTILFGLGCTIRKKFSASNYWKDCAKFKCTVAQYVGEICRYVLSASNKESVNHSVRAIFGNGLKPQIWKEFVNTFKIKEVYEFYGATEGISNMINIDNTPGCIGFIPRYASFMYPVTLIKCNMVTGDPIRDSNGFCMRCGINEPGLVINKINYKSALQSFKGYADEKATSSKILQNVFSEGDSYFNSGDILEQDEFGYYYFRDRTGDTFRWKGENVSTSEVEGIISNIVKLNDAVVYGVEIPNTEGRAGMAAIVDTDNSLDLKELAKGLKENLPSYAVPVFIRVMKSVPMTGTYKLKKTELQTDGYDLEKVKDQMYFYDNKSKTYVELTQQLYSDIVAGKISI
ncbi:hypothetical protein FQR65_LT11493 [Abscondita terminalis]|nr:hypothetical protein FQR65_LT11493 [Abscondita terminalis]